jgi:hypothetical protein
MLKTSSAPKKEFELIWKENKIKWLSLPRPSLYKVRVWPWQLLITCELQCGFSVLNMSIYIGIATGTTTPRWAKNEALGVVNNEPKELEMMKTKQNEHIYPR